MLDYLDTLAAKKGHKEIVLDVTDTNMRAAILYEQNGFHKMKYVKTGRFFKRLGFNGIIEMKKTIL